MKSIRTSGGRAGLVGIIAAVVLALPFGVCAQTSEGMGLATCAQFADLYRTNPDFAERVFFSWAEGYMTAWNVASFAHHIAVVPLSPMSKDEQMGFIRRFCDENPLKQYFSGVTALLGELKRLPPKGPSPSGRPGQ